MVITFELLDTSVNDLPRVVAQQCGGRKTNPHLIDSV